MPNTKRCPICHAKLAPGKGLRMHCPTDGCDFVDRRDGISVLDPEVDRRDRKIHYHNKLDDPFYQIRWKK
jgi:hypothetical protein